MGIFDAIGNLFGGGSHMSPGGVPIPQPKPAPQASSPFMLQNPRDMNALSKFGFLMRSAGDPNFAMNYSLMLSAQEKEQRELEKEQAMQEWLQGADLPDNVRSLAQFDPSIAGKYILQENDPYRATQSALAQLQLNNAIADQNKNAAIQGVFGGSAEPMGVPQGMPMSMPPNGGALSQFPQGATPTQAPQSGYLAKLGQLAQIDPESYGPQYLAALNDASKPKAPMTQGLPAGYQWQNGEAVKIPGVETKQDAERETKENAMQSVNRIAQEMRASYDRLYGMGGEVVTKNRGALANMQARLRSSDIGQGIMGMVGDEAQIERDNIESMRPLLMNYIRQATNMGAKGLDSEKELEFYLRAATDPKRGYEANMQALQRIVDAYGTGGELKDTRKDRKTSNQIEADNEIDDLVNMYRKK